MTGRGGGPLNIWLYTAIPERNQFRPLVRPSFQRAKSFARHNVNRLATQLSGRLLVDDFHYQIANNLEDNSNRGDIAIRLAVREQIASAASQRRVNFVELKWGTLTPDVINEINRNCDLFVIGGGGYLFINGDGSGGASFADIPRLQEIHCPIIAYGIGLNRLMHEEVRDLRDLPAITQKQIRDFNAACRHIGVRDAQTQELLNLYGGRDVSLIGDPVLFLHHPEIEASAKKKTFSHPSIGINLAAHGWRALAVLKPLLPHIVELLKYIERSHGAKFTYLVHHDFEEKVISFLRQRGIQLDVAHLETLQLLDVYKSMDFVICQMLHSCIFASNQDVPFFNIAYDQKNAAFCEILGIPQCSIPHLDVTAQSLKTRFDELFADRDSITRTMTANKIPLRIAQREFARLALASVASAPLDFSNQS